MTVKDILSLTNDFQTQPLAFIIILRGSRLSYRLPSILYIVRWRVLRTGVNGLTERGGALGVKKVNIDKDDTKKNDKKNKIR